MFVNQLRVGVQKAQQRRKNCSNHVIIPRSLTPFTRKTVIDIFSLRILFGNLVLEDFDFFSVANGLFPLN